MKSKAQSSVEYTFIVAFALAIIIPAAVLFYRYSADSQENLASAQISRIGNDIIDSAELMFSVGENSWQTLEFSVPIQVQRMQIIYDNDSSPPLTEFVISHGDAAVSDSVFFTAIPLRNLSPGNLGYTNCTAGCDIYVKPGLNKLRVTSNVNDVVVLEIVE